MSEEDIEKIAEAVFQKILAKQIELDAEFDKELENGWATTTTWFKYSTEDEVTDPFGTENYYIEMLTRLNVEKAEALAAEDYIKVIKIEDEIKQTKKQLDDLRNNKD